MSCAFGDITSKCASSTFIPVGFLKNRLSENANTYLRNGQWVVKLIKWPPLHHVTTMRNPKLDNAGSSAFCTLTSQQKRERKEQ